MARAVGESSLVKTAINGRDPNWGRVSQAVGQALAGSVGPVAEPVVSVNGVPYASAAAAEVLAREEYDLEVALDRGGGRRGAVGLGPRPRLRDDQRGVPHLSGPPG